MFGSVNGVVPQYEYTVPKSYLISMVAEYSLTNRTNFMEDMTELYLSYPEVEVNGDSYIPSVYSVDYYDRTTKVTTKHFKVRIPKAGILSLVNFVNFVEGLDHIPSLQHINMQMVYGKFE